MNISPRTQSLLDRLPNHPLTPAMRNAMIDALTAPENAVAHKRDLAKDGTRTTLGLRQAVQEAIKAKYGKALARAKEPVVKARKEFNARRDAMQVKAIDPTNFVAEFRRMEMRTYLCSLEPNARQSLALTTNNQFILESIVTAEIPELAGFGGHLAQVFPQVQQRYIELTYPNEIAELEAMETVIAEAEASMQIAYNDMQNVSDLQPREFDSLMRNVDTPWLGKIGNQIIRVRPEKIGTAELNMPATPDEIATGKFYANEAEYRADRAQGMAAA